MIAGFKAGFIAQDELVYEEMQNFSLMYPASINKIQPLFSMMGWKILIL